MKIIPAIDYMNGKVVLAEKGDRSNYKVIRSNLCKQADLASIIESILSLANFNVIYIADLDCIENKQLNKSLWLKILNSYPHIEFWLDLGNQVSPWKQLMQNTKNARPIIGSESFPNLSTLENGLHIVKDSNPLLSIDIKNNKTLGPKNLLDDFNQWPQDIIILSLNRVGSLMGPDVDLLAKYKAKLSNCNIYAGGGIRNIQDIQHLDALGLAGVLLAKSLHNGALGHKELAQLVVNNF